MLSSIVIFLCLTSVMAIDSGFLDDYQRVCLNGAEPYNLAKLIDEYKYPAQDCDHSFGFHFKTDLCPDKPNDITDTSAFFSDDRQFIYLYYSLDGNQRATEGTEKSFKVLDRDNSLFVVWIKELMSRGHFTHPVKFEISYTSTKQRNEKAMIELKSHQIDEQLLIKDFGKGSSVTIRSTQANQNFSRNPISISDSYQIRCARKKYRSNDDTYVFTGLSGYDCVPQEDEERIRCDCGEPKTHSVAYYIFGFICIVSILAAKPIAEALLEVESIRRNDKTSVLVNVNCGDDEWNHRDTIAIRLAKDSPYSDLVNVMIDVEFFSEDSIAPEQRFKADILDARPVTDFKIILLRMTKLPELKYMSCKHTGDTELKINLLGVILEPNGSERKRPEVYKLNKHIVHTSRRYKLKIFKDDKKNRFDDSDLFLNNVRLSEISLNIVEMTFILFVVISFVNIVSAFFHNLLVHVGLAFGQIMALIVICYPFGIAFNLFFVWLYKSLVLKEAKQKTQMSAKHEQLFCKIFWSFYIGCMLVALLVFDVVTCLILWQHTLLETYNWFSASFCTSALTAMTWMAVSHYRTARKKPRKVTDGDMTGSDEIDV